MQGHQLRNFRLHVYVHHIYSDYSLIPMPPTPWSGYEGTHAGIVALLVKSCDVSEDDLLQEAHALLLCPHLPVHHHWENTIQP